MKAIIFGAGASYDWVNSFNENHIAKLQGKDLTEAEFGNIYNTFWDYEWRPPITKEIFSRSNFISKVLSGYPRASYVKNEMAGRDNLEELFQDLYKRCSIDKPRNEVMMKTLIETKFYLRQLFSTVSNECANKRGVSNYSKLIGRADEWGRENNEPILYITFNYDTILENELSQFYGHHFNHIDDYFNQQWFKLFKPHGSCNWHSEIKVDKLDNNRSVGLNAILSNNLIPLSEYNSLDKEIIVKTKYNIGDVMNLNNADEPNILEIPRLSIPLAAKDVFQLPSNRIKEMETYLSYIDEILVIGWRATEEHFTSLLQKNIRDKKILITVVDIIPSTAIGNLLKCIPDAKINSNHLRQGINLSVGESAMIYHEPGGFSDFILNNKEIFFKK